MLMTDEEYTKHYYIEGERVCSKIGSGFGVAPYDPQGAPVDVLAGDFYDLQDDLHTMVQRGMACVGYDEEFTISEELKPAHNSASDPENDQYFYHPDHLGSSSFITDLNGNGIQHLQYLPFGESFVDQQIGQWNTPYKFSGKEKDDETGYSYFGARYYDSDLSVWLSVDPLASEYPFQSPYNYCSLSPIMRIDLNGMNDGWYLGEDNQTHYDVNVNCQKDLDDKGICGTYIGRTGTEASNDGLQYSLNEDGSKMALDIFEFSDKRVAHNENTVQTVFVGNSAPWIDYAMSEIGQKEHDPGDNPRIVEYLNSAGNLSKNDETPWCAAFVHWCLKQAGIKGAGAVGSSYLNWGEKVDNPTYGEIAVFKTGHVGFYLGTNNDGTLKILHGNWSNRVKISSGIYDPIYPSQIREYRMPRSVMQLNFSKYFLLLLISLFSCAGNPIKVSHNELADQKSVTLRKNEIVNFEQFWKEFGIAIQQYDTNRIKQYVEVPLNIYGHEDQDPRLKIDSNDIVHYVIYAVENGGYYDEIKDVSVSYRTLFQTDLKDIPEFDINSDVQWIHDFVFKKTVNGWKLVTMYMNTIDIEKKMEK